MHIHDRRDIGLGDQEETELFNLVHQIVLVKKMKCDDVASLED